MAVPPFYDPLDEREYLAYHAGLAEVAPELAIMAYNHPGAAGGGAGIALLEALVDAVPSVRYLKDSSGDAAAFADLLAHFDDERLRVFNGADSLTFQALAVGARGSVWGAASFAPELAVALFDALARDADLPEAGRRLWELHAPDLRAARTRQLRRRGEGGLRAHRRARRRAAAAHPAAGRRRPRRAALAARPGRDRRCRRVSERLDAVVIGGGIAGLTAAWQLRHRRVLLLEAGDRLGGRLRSEPRGDGWLNFGAHLFPGPGTVIDGLLRDLDLRTLAITDSAMGLALGDRVLTSGPVETYVARLPLTAAERIALARAGVRIRRAVAQRARAASPLEFLGHRDSSRSSSATCRRGSRRSSNAQHTAPPPSPRRSRRAAGSGCSRSSGRARAR